MSCRLSLSSLLSDGLALDHQEFLDGVLIVTAPARAAEDTAIIQRVFEDHRTGHITDEAALHALRLTDIEKFVAHRILTGHDISERPDFADVVASARKNWKEVRQS